MVDKKQVLSALKKVCDPELGVNVVDLGLVYDVAINDGQVNVQMSLTTPFCPIGPQFLQEVEDAICSVAGVVGAKVEMVWDPPWSANLMSDTAKSELGML